MLHKSTLWKWGKAEWDAFATSKKLLLSSRGLAHFDQNLPIILACDASAQGIGAIVSHKYPDGSERSFGFVLRTLNNAEKQYPQVEKEGLACIFGVSRFHTYIFGYPFTLMTDNKLKLSCHCLTLPDMYRLKHLATLVFKTSHVSVRIKISPDSSTC